MLTLTGKTIKGIEVILYQEQNLSDYVAQTLLNLVEDKVDSEIEKYVEKMNESSEYYITLRVGYFEVT